ncbi:MAG: LPS export ABC transporter periplasmic protein LptC [Gammaproteobacteria bacterium]
MLPKWFTPLTVAIVAGLSIWLLSREAPKQQQLITINKSIPDTFMENLSTYNLDKKGILRHELKADYMAHYPFDDHSDFKSPELILYHSGKKHWSISADKGTTKKDIDEIILQGKVNIYRLDKTTGKPDLTINTAEVLIRPDEAYLETDKTISITSGKQRIQSVGIRANLDAGTVELLSHVRGVYAL